MRPSQNVTGTLFPELTESRWNTSSRQSAEIATNITTLELCAGGGGQALGLEWAGIDHAGLVEIDPRACETLRMNRPAWNVIEQDLNTFDGTSFKGVDVISGGLPCPPFSVAGKQLGRHDERNLFPALIRLVDQIRPRAVMIENVRGILDPVFAEYRRSVTSELKKLGFETGWKLMNACDFGVPQLRPRVVLVAILRKYSDHFFWPEPVTAPPNTVGKVLYDLMSARGWKGAKNWANTATDIAPTVVGGSHKHGGPDLGPSRARRAWLALGVNGLGIADDAPEPDYTGLPKLTVRMVARIQGFPDSWEFSGRKTAAYRQVGNAFPPPFARAVAGNLKACLCSGRRVRMAG